MTELVFIHGWGFDARFWDALAALLPDYPQRRIERGFFGQTQDVLKPGGSSVLIGHSLGFVHGMTQKQDWAGWVAINGFAHFVQDAGQTGCVPGFMLREMRARLAADTKKTLADFYGLIGATAPKTGAPDTEQLKAGLDELRDADVGEILAGMKVPGLVLASRDDVLVPAAASEALADRAGTRLIWHPDGDHILPQSDAAFCAAAIKDFLASLIGG